MFVGRLLGVGCSGEGPILAHSLASGCVEIVALVHVLGPYPKSGSELIRPCLQSLCFGGKLLRLAKSADHPVMNHQVLLGEGFPTFEHLNRQLASRP